MSKSQQDPLIIIASPFKRGGKIFQVLDKTYCLAVMGMNSDLAQKLVDMAPKQENVLEAVGYTALCVTNNALEFGKSRLQLGLATYEQSWQAVRAEPRKTLGPSFLHLANRVSYRIGCGAVLGATPDPWVLATIDTVLSPITENYKGAAAETYGKHSVSFGNWLKQEPLKVICEGAALTFGRQVAQWHGIYWGREKIKKHTSLDHNQATYIAVSITSALTTGLDMVRTQMCSRSNADLSFVDKVAKTKDIMLAGKGWSGGLARAGAQTAASLLSVKAMEWSSRVYKEHAEGVVRPSR